MREILFRGKDTASRGWKYGDLLHAGNRQVIVEGNEPCMTMPGTVGQYTGHHDQHGEKIFEGDIVIDACELYVVEYRPEIAGFARKRIGNDANVLWVSLYDSDADKLTVIGNIFDTPDLLEAR